MNISQELLQKLTHVDGKYARRITAVETIPGGIQARLTTVAFRNVGDQQRPIILSNEALAQQITATGVPNRPPDMHLSEQTQADEFDNVVLQIQVLASDVVRVRLGLPDQLAQNKDAGILLPGLVQGWQSLPVPEVQQTEAEVSLQIADISIRLQRDPFALRIVRTGGIPVTLSTAEDDRNVHGLLCTPLPGVGYAQGGAAEAFWSWALDPDEHLYGLGERFGAFDQRGHNIHQWTQDAWGTTTDASYKCVPFLLSSRHYALFCHTTTPVDWQLGTSSMRAATVRAGESALDLFAIFGDTPKKILAEYTQLTGRATLPPRWAFGVWLSRCRYKSRAEVEAVAERVRAEHVPCDVLHIDPAWLQYPNVSCDFVANEEVFPDLPGMLHEFSARNLKISLWELPYVSAQATRYQEALAAGYFLRDEHGEAVSADFGTPPADGYTRAIVDFTNPAARAWWQDLHRPWLRAGVAVFKTDFGEAIPLNARAFNGMTGHELHNLYPLLYHGAVHEVITQETGRPGMIWGRSGWAGIQRYPAQWGGDPKTDVWSMRSALRGGLGFALSAPGLWSHDIGGFYGPPPSKELYIRWAQFGLLSPLARAHGTTPREPWEFGTEALSIFKRYALLRMRLNLYLYNLAWEMHTQGLPMLRPLLLEFPHDPATAQVDDVYMLGDSLLIAPIFNESHEAVERTLYLPDATWFDFWTDEQIRGGRYITRVAPLDTLPIYVKAGTILPLGPEQEFIGEQIPDTVTLEVYVGAEGTTQIVWDADGASTQVHVYLESQQWRLDIQGARELTWLVRWHTGIEVIEGDLGRTNAARSTLSF